MALSRSLVSGGTYQIRSCSFHRTGAATTAFVDEQDFGSICRRLDRSPASSRTTAGDEDIACHFKFVPEPSSISFAGRNHIEVGKEEVHRILPLVTVIAAGGWLVAWHGSLQHEVIHGHPTRNQRLNNAIGWPPLSLWLPYAIYREGHLVHHRDEHLTDPIEDPESSYFTQATWNALGRFGRSLAEWNTTLLGRLTIGPIVMIGNFLVEEAILIVRGDKQSLRLWSMHSLGVCLVLTWVLVVCAMPLWLYLIGFVYVGAALTRLRSYAEHRYADHHSERTAIVENSPLFGLLFLYNNLHVLHHLRPGIPWYQIPKIYRDNRSAFVAANGGLVYDGYADVARRFLFKPHDDPRHPNHRNAGSSESTSFQRAGGNSSDNSTGRRTTLVATD